MHPPYRTTQSQGITDLTVLAEVKPGLIEGSLETESYTERLQVVLTVLNAVRQAASESALLPSPFPDSVGRFRDIHFFRFAVLPAVVERARRADSAALPPIDIDDRTPDRLLLNVTFDGGWEPYMRLIWGPLGTLLDLVYCHCVGYPMAFRSSFDDYMRWVRANERPSGFFYADSASTVADRGYLAELERLHAASGGAADIDRRATALALPPRPATVLPGELAIQVSLRLLGALYKLAPLFPGKTHEEDQGVLLRFAQDLLADLRGWVADGLFDPGAPYAMLRRGDTGAAVDWLMRPRWRPPASERLEFRRSDVQAGIAAPFPADVLHGMVALFGIDAPEPARQAARTWLATAPVTAGDAVPPDGVWRNLALTLAGLRRLGVPPWRLERLPQEFIDGMEARAGILGDVRGNHPEQWRRPTLADGSTLELGTVHVVVQLRTAARTGETDAQVQQRLQREAEALGGAATGLRLFASQPMRSIGIPSAGQRARGHLGFADAISQPVVADAPPPEPPAYWNDHVTPGEIFLGHPNSRDPVPCPPVDGEKLGDLLLDNGSFVVVRKLRQHMDRLQRAVSTAAQAAAPTPSQADALGEELLARMVGRRRDGTPLVGVRGSGDNDFDFRADAPGEQCPHRSHVRRVNPRDTQPRTTLPRIMRRGMSYGEPLPPGTPAGAGDDRGLVFIAYNASLAEQFEVMQRWITGGNASGLASTHDDPLLGVPQPGRPRIFRCLVGDRVLRLDLGDAPLVSLQWGLYAFAPSPAALRAIDRIVASPPPPPEPAPRHAPPLGVEGERWRRLLEDGNSRDAAWASMNDDGVRDAAGYGLLVGRADRVLEVLKDGGGRFSTCGYAERMDRSIGVGFLGQDDEGPHDGHRRHAPQVNRAIEDWLDEQGACAQATAVAAALLPQSTENGPAGVDIVRLAGGVLARLCADWFGLPDGHFMTAGGEAGLVAGAPCLPGSFLGVSRYIFSTPHPARLVETLGRGNGARIARAVADWLADTARDPGAARGRRGPLTHRILAALPGDDAALQARILAGVMLGMPPTVLGNFVGVLKKWIAGRELWELQQALRAADADAAADSTGPAAGAGGGSGGASASGAAGGSGGAGAPLDEAAAAAARALEVLRRPLLQTMRRGPVPYAVWRTAAAAPGSFGRTPVKPGRRLVVGLGAAVKAEHADPMLMFGGQRHGDDQTVHACPGYKLAIGILVGTTAALLRAGTLRPDGAYSLRVDRVVPPATTTAGDAADPARRPAPATQAEADEAGPAGR